MPIWIRSTITASFSGGKGWFCPSGDRSVANPSASGSLPLADWSIGSGDAPGAGASLAPGSEPCGGFSASRSLTRASRWSAAICFCAIETIA